MTISIRGVTHYSNGELDYQAPRISNLRVLVDLHELSILGLSSFEAILFVGFQKGTKRTTEAMLGIQA